MNVPQAIESPASRPEGFNPAAYESVRKTHLFHCPYCEEPVEIDPHPGCCGEVEYEEVSK
jgi:hypothetical protein